MIAGAVAGLLTMLLHPTAHDLVPPADTRLMSLLAVGVHALALLSLPVAFLGAMALAQRLAAPDRLALAALVVYGFALAAVMQAAAASGFLAPGLLRQTLASSPPESDMWRTLSAYNGGVNQAFARIFTVGSALAIVLWSAAIVRRRAMPRALGIYGLLSGALIVLAAGSGSLRLDVHGFGAVVLLESVWLIACGVQLRRPPAPVAAPVEAAAA